MLPDLINGVFESCGGFFIWLSVIKLAREKVVRGVSWMHVAFFSAWGLWNLFYYPHLGQWLSFFGGVFLVSINAVWLGQIIFYNYVTNAHGELVMRDDEPAKGPSSWRGTKRYRHSDK